MATSAQNQSFASLPVAAKVAILFFILVFLSGLYYFGLHMSLADEITAAEAQHRTKLGERTEARQRLQEFTEIQQVLAEREPIDLQSRRVLPETAEMAAFLEEIHQTAELSGIEMVNVEPQTEEPGEFYDKVPVALRLRGSHHEVAKFLYGVMRLERAVSMENMSLIVSNASDEEADPILDISVRAITFKRPAAQSGGPAGPAPQGGA